MPAAISRQTTPAVPEKAVMNGEGDGEGQGNAVGESRRLVPLWRELMRAFPRLGPVATVSRNLHAVTGRTGTHAELWAAGDGVMPVCYHTPFTDDCGEIWYYPERVRGEILSGFELRDRAGHGFHKVILRSGSDAAFATLLRRAFDDGPLSAREVEGAWKTNHLDSPECIGCRKRLWDAGAAAGREILRFLNRASADGHFVRIILPHGSLLSVSRMVPETVEMQGVWLAAKQGGDTLFVRPHGVADIENFSGRDSDFVEGMTLRDAFGELFLTLLNEGKPRG